jgi:hypothetical protein
MLHWKEMLPQGTVKNKGRQGLGFHSLVLNGNFEVL